jgi:hypothetical protein
LYRPLPISLPGGAASLAATPSAVGTGRKISYLHTITHVCAHRFHSIRLAGLVYFAQHSSNTADVSVRSPPPTLSPPPPGAERPTTLTTPLGTCCQHFHITLNNSSCRQLTASPAIGVALAAIDGVAAPIAERDQRGRLNSLSNCFTHTAFDSSLFQVARCNISLVPTVASLPPGRGGVADRDAVRYGTRAIGFLPLQHHRCMCTSFS